MIGIEHISTYLPMSRIENLSRLEQFEINDSFISDKIGMVELAVKDKGDDTSDLCVKAVNQLLIEKGEILSEIECLIVCTQNPDNYGLPHTSAIVHGKLDLPSNCACFDVSLGCSGYVYSLSIIKSFMEANGYKKGLLITADPYSKVIDMNDKNTSLLFGDAATVTLMSDQPKWQIGKSIFGTDGSRNEAIQVRASDRKFEMAGRAVLDFCANIVPDNIRETLSVNNFQLADIDKFILHQGSKFIVNMIIKRMELDPAKVPFEASSYGNTVSSSIPMILANENDAQSILLSGFGVGVSWGSVVLMRD
ncbi:3-oxoacyl-ACP synthase [Hahella sp. CCB-MM4]|uniref:ketoacyl-ACP synthase III n=1 Tax=Hahella sp. (strain CCB-MM4) TaxID=1926491 RepID=UPI000B9BB368|nr:ketoacyl-ACP synthase III [Hahella sp. CCB-MM4]OZG73677.1 3-oxoacyl-ACP synthase [Hahella sp. CCB-MM4]